MNSTFAAPSTASQATGLMQIETLATLEMLTGIPAVEWLECPAESPEQRAARLERIADVMLDLDDTTARRVAGLHRAVLAEAPVLRVDDRVFGPVTITEPVTVPSTVPLWISRARTVAGAASVRRAVQAA